MREDTLVKNAITTALTKWGRSASSKPAVSKFEFSLGEDHSGQQAVYVSVVLTAPRRGAYHWLDLKPLNDLLAKAIQDKAPFRWPYVRFRLAPDDAARPAGA
jgi:hypothetical protein